MSKFFHSRDLNFIKTISEEVVDYVVEQSITLYKMSVGETKTNLYGESLDKIYHAPANLMCIIDREPQSPEYENMGFDITQLVEFRFNRERLRTHELPHLRDIYGTEIPVGAIQNTTYGYPETGDVIEYDGNFYEINHIRENNRLVGGAPKIWDEINNRFDDTRVELIAPALLVRNSQVQIKPQSPIIPTPVPQFDSDQTTFDSTTITF